MASIVLLLGVRIVFEVPLVELALEAKYSDCLTKVVDSELDGDAVLEGTPISMYPKSSSSELPQPSYGYPGHGSLQLEISTVANGEVFEHQQCFPLTIARA